MNISLEDIYHYTNHISNSLGRLSQQKEETMNDNLNPEFKPVPVKLTDAEVEKLLATKEPFDGQVAFLTDTDETSDEPSPTLH